MLGSFTLFRRRVLCSSSYRPVRLLLAQRIAVLLAQSPSTSQHEAGRKEDQPAGRPGARSAKQTSAIAGS